jgi:MFS family permease
MAVQGLEQTTTRLDQAKRFGGWVLAALVIAALVVAALIISGLIGFVPSPQVRVLGVTLPPEWTAFVGAFTLALVLILTYVYLARLVRSSLQKLLEFWRGLPGWVQAIVLGVVAGAVAGFSLYLTNVYLYWFEITTMVGLSVATGVIVTLLTIWLRDQGWTLREWVRVLTTSALIAGIVAIVGSFAFAGVVPGWTPPAVFLAGWAICLYLQFRRHQAIGGSFVTRVLTQTGYAQMRQVETVPVSVGTGMVFAFIIAALVGTFGTAPESTVRRAAFSVVLVWPVITVATSFGWPSRERTALVIVDINVRSSTDLREVTIRNLGDQPVDLRGAKMTDAHDKLYRVAISASLGAGETAKFEIPQSFEMAIHDRYEVFSLPFGLVVTREAAEPRVVTRDGRLYKLLWIDQLPESGEGAAA